MLRVLSLLFISTQIMASVPADKDIFESAVGFAKSVEAGEVKVKDEAPEEAKDVTPNTSDGNKDIM